MAKRIEDHEIDELDKQLDNIYAVIRSNIKPEQKTNIVRALLDDLAESINNIRYNPSVKE